MTINIENFKKVRTAVAENEMFSMHDFLHPCGTAACIVGSAAVLIGAVEKNTYLDDEGENPLVCYLVDEKKVAEWLGLSDEDDGLERSERDFLFYCHWTETDRENITQAEALTYLDKVIETGDVRVTID